MKKTGVFLLAIVLVFTMYACNTDGPVSPTDGTDTAPFSPPLNTAPPEAAEPALLWDSALYESILEEARTDFSEALDASYYLLYDITQDGIPELMLKQDDGILRIFTQQKQQNVLLGEFDATRGVPCGYHHGDGLLLCQTSWQCVDHLVTDIKNRHIARLQTGECSISPEFFLFPEKAERRHSQVWHPLSQWNGNAHD